MGCPDDGRNNDRRRRVPVETTAQNRRRQDRGHAVRAGVSVPHFHSWRVAGENLAGITSPPCCCPRQFRPAGSSTTHTKCQLVQRHESYYVPKGKQVCPFITADTAFPRGSRCALLLQPTRYFQGRAGVPFYYSRHGISKGEQVCLLLQPLCCGWFFSGVAGDGTVVLGPDGGVSTGTSRCSDRHDRDGDRRQLVLPVATTIFAGRDGVIIRYGGAVDYRPTNQAIEAETYGRQDTGNGSGQGWDERAFSAQVAEWAIAVAGETGASVAHPARPLRRGVGG